MPRRDADGEAAQAGAADSVKEEMPLEITELVRGLPWSKAEQKAEAHTRALDAAYFRAHPGVESYVRPYHPGELPALVLLPYATAPSHVAVGRVDNAGERTRVFIWPGYLHATARRNAEAAAEAQRVKLGMRGTA